MKIELDASRFDEGVGDFDIGHILFDTQAQRQVESVKFSGFAEIDDEGLEHETINVHFVGVADEVNGLIVFDDLEHAVYQEWTFEPIAPAWFVEEVKGEVEGKTNAEADQFFASSKTCGNCGHIKDDLTLSDRTYHCTECGFGCDRDVNAAINLCPV